MKIHSPISLMPALIRSSQPQGTAISQSNQVDRFEINFGAASLKSQQRAAMTKARVKTAELLKVPVHHGRVELDALRQAFYNGYYQSLADTAIAGWFPDHESLELARGGHVDHTPSDYCYDSKLLNEAMSKKEKALWGVYKTPQWYDVLGYKSQEGAEADMPRFLEQTAEKIGLPYETRHENIRYYMLNNMDDSLLEKAFF